MGLEDVCRLCLTTDDLVWVFDKRFENSDNMKDIIYVTTGVEITDKDIVSQKVCRKCCQVTIKMYEFRRTSLKNDQLLKDQCKMYLKEKEIKIPNTQVTIRTEPKKDLNVSVHNGTKPAEAKQETKSPYKIHPSVRELFREYPKIKLPTVCLKYDITPNVSMTMNQVEEYFKSRHLDFQKCTKLAMRVGGVAMKKTAPMTKAKNSIPLSAPKIIKNERKDKTPKSEINVHKGKHADYKHNSDIISKEKIKSYFKDTSKSAAKNQVSSPVTIVGEELSSNKRKLPKDEKTGNIEFKKSNFVETLGLTAKADPPGVLSYVANKSQPVHICEICNSVQYSAKDLRKHQNKHLRCQFCKIKLRSLDMKKEHLEKMCKIKNMMRTMPQVVLKKIECIESVRIKYPEAFESFPPMKNLSNENPALMVGNLTNSLDKVADFKGFDNKIDLKTEPPKQNTSAPCEIIELSDDEEPLAPACNVGNQRTSVIQTPQPLTPTANVLKEGTPLVLCASLLQTPQSSAQCFNVSNVGRPSIPSGVPVPDMTVLQQDNIVYNTVSIVRPDIKIKGSCALDVIDAKLTDIKVLKELLTNYRPVHMFTDKDVQTYPQLISVNCNDITAELQLLKPQLYVYKIPVVMKNGNFNVCYSNSSERNQPKKLCLWNDLTAIDLKPPKILPPVNKTVLPSTATYKSSGGVVSWSAQPTISKFIRINASSLSPMITNSLYNPSDTETTTLANNLETPTSNTVKTLDTNLASSVTQQIDKPLNSTAVQRLDTTSALAAQQSSPTQTSYPVQQFGTIRVKNVWELT